MARRNNATGSCAVMENAISSVAIMSKEILISGEMYLTGFVGDDFFEDGFTYYQVATALAEHGRAKDLIVHLNSGGGFVDDGKAIYNAFRSHRGKVTIQVEGVAASAASLIFMGADTRVMQRGSLLMLHNPYSFAAGDKGEMAKALRFLEADTDSMADIYAEHSGQTIEDVLAQMDSETWLNPTEALAQGYCDKVEKGAKAVSASAFPYRMYAHAPGNVLALADAKGWTRAELRSQVMATQPTPNQPNQQPAPTPAPAEPPAPSPARRDDVQPGAPEIQKTAAAAPADVVAACMRDGVPALAERLIRQGASMTEVAVSVTEASDIRQAVADARQRVPLLDPMLGDQLIAAGASLSHARATIFERMQAVQNANQTSTAFQPSSAASNPNNDYSDEAVTKAWAKAIATVNGRTPGKPSNVHG